MDYILEKSIDVNTVSKNIEDIRNELNLNRGVMPYIQNVVELEDTVFVIVGDRAEKSQCIGPGGRIVAELSKRVGKKISILSKTELDVRKSRLDLSLGRIEEIKDIFESRDTHLLKNIEVQIANEKLYPMYEEVRQVEDQGSPFIVAYSGGIDSSAVLILLKQWGFSPIAVTADPGPQILPPHLKSAIEKFCREMDIPQVYVNVEDKIKNTLQGALEGRFHPCGRCHSILIDSVKEYALSEKHQLLVTGELLPHGRQAFEFSDNVLVIHLLAALAMTKFRTMNICDDKGLQIQSNQFGCQLLSKLHGTIPGMVQPSIDRVLRELEAGILTTGMAMNLIRSILRPANKSQINPIGD
jgi:predicted PP-loop superfamily ATPase